MSLLFPFVRGQTYDFTESEYFLPFLSEGSSDFVALLYLALEKDLLKSRGRKAKSTCIINIILGLKENFQFQLTDGSFDMVNMRAAIGWIIQDLEGKIVQQHPRIIYSSSVLQAEA
ncbi:hypothetical protein ACH5RR_009662 [Cinchona calisaya]|uniref:Uncharacterized protein n=1 Tax=Cinchona calisaya TaxID=153742 RepID=A0ABD3AHY6_9GENT